jgi:hypothetical protein
MKSEPIRCNQGAHRSESPTSRHIQTQSDAIRRNQTQSDAIRCNQKRTDAIRERTGQDHPRAAVTTRPDATLASLPRQSQLRPKRERDRGPGETPQVCDETHVRGQFRRSGVPDEGRNQTQVCNETHVRGQFRRSGVPDEGRNQTQVCDETHVRGQFRRSGVPDEGRNQTHSDAISQGAEYLMKEAIRRTQMQSPKGRRTAVQG